MRPASSGTSTPSYFARASHRSFHSVNASGSGRSSGTAGPPYLLGFHRRARRRHATRPIASPVPTSPINRQLALDELRHEIAVVASDLGHSDRVAVEPSLLTRPRRPLPVSRARVQSEALAITALRLVSSGRRRRIHEAAPPRRLTRGPRARPKATRRPAAASSSSRKAPSEARSEPSGARASRRPQSQGTQQSEVRRPRR